MTTASRMESTGIKGRIQCSQETADLLIAAGKERWLKPRQSESGLRTYFLDTNAGSSACADSDVIGGSQPFFDGLPQDKGRRLVNWNVDNMLQLLKQIAAARRPTPGKRSKVVLDEKKIMLEQQKPGKLVIDEVQEIINLPDYKAGSRSSYLRLWSTSCATTLPRSQHSTTPIHSTTSSMPLTLPWRFPSSCRALWLRQISIQKEVWSDSGRRFTITRMESRRIHSRSLHASFRLSSMMVM
jgi:hypothetical protein